MAYFRGEFIALSPTKIAMLARFLALREGTRSIRKSFRGVATQPRRLQHHPHLRDKTLPHGPTLELGVLGQALEPAQGAAGEL